MAADIAAVVGNHQGEHVLRDCLESLTRADAAAAPSDRRRRRVDRPQRRGRRGARRARAPRTEPRARLPLQPRRARGRLPTTSSSRTTTSRTSRTASRGSPPRSTQTRSRFAADPTQLGWDDGRVIHARTKLAPRPPLARVPPRLAPRRRRARGRASCPTVSAHGAAMLVRRKPLLELGLFDESFFMEWEDLDLCWRAWLRGWPTVYVPDARLRHRVGAVTTEARARDDGARRRTTT